MQAHLTGAIWCAYLGVRQQRFPRMSTKANVADGIMSSLSLLTLLLACFAASVPMDMEVVKMTGIVVLAAGVECFSILALIALRDRFSHRPLYNHLVCHHQNEAAAQACYLKVLLRTQQHGAAILLNSRGSLDLAGSLDSLRCKANHIIAATLMSFA